MEAIMNLERVTAAHWRGTEEEWLGGWLLRAAEGFTGRANSALPLGDPGVPLEEALAVVGSWYRARGLPPMIALPSPLAADRAAAADGPGRPGQAGQAGQWASPLDEFLGRRNWPARRGPAIVMLAAVPLAGPRTALPAGATILVSPEPGGAWAASYHYQGQDHLPLAARKVLTSAREQSFISVTAGDTVLAIARLSVDGGLAGLTAVKVHPGYRRRGLGRAITNVACDMAAERGITRVFLQVEEDNAPARALYAGLGFRASHHYRYRMAPGQ